MKVLILQGSPRKNGNTKQFSAPFIDELQKTEQKCRKSGSMAKS